MCSNYHFGDKCGHIICDFTYGCNLEHGPDHQDIELLVKVKGLSAGSTAIPRPRARRVPTTLNAATWTEAAANARGSAKTANGNGTSNGNGRHQDFVTSRTEARSNMQVFRNLEIDCDCS